MDLVYIHYFMKAAEMQHITKAAEALSITQPTLSTAIKRMEAEFGMRLFDSFGRNVCLTEAGKVLYRHFTSISREWDSIYRDMEALKEQEKNRLNIVCPSQFLGRNIFAAVYKINPNITFNYCGRFDLQTAGMMEEGKIDIIVSTPAYYSSHYETEILAPDPIVVIMGKNHRLASSREISITDLKNEQFISYPASTLRDAIGNICQKAGFSPNVVCEMHNVRDMIPIISVGTMIAMCPAGACSEAYGAADIVIRSVSGIHNNTELGLSYSHIGGDKGSRNTVVQVIRSLYLDNGDKT